MKDGIEVRRKLKRLGTRREQLRKSSEKLQGDTRRVLVEAQGVVPVTECASLLKLERTTIYQVYRKKE